MEENRTYTAFRGTGLLASGPLEGILSILKAEFDRDPGSPVLVFEDETGRQADFDLRGSLAEVLTAAIASTRRRPGPGRPKLGVVAREVSLLPRHWEWLEQQPNGASAALRRLVDQARNHNPAEQRARQVIEAAGRFLSSMAGNYPGYEEASRALYGGHRARFEEIIHDWPAPVRDYLLRRLESVPSDGA